MFGTLLDFWYMTDFLSLVIYSLTICYTVTMDEPSRVALENGPAERKMNRRCSLQEVSHLELGV